MAQAPTGIGKTIGTLFPLLKAAPGQALDKVFFLTAKTSGRQLALDALALIQAARRALPLRVLELVARDKACEHPDKACHGDSCPLAQGFYDRLPAARSAALATRASRLDKAALREVALAHQVCPYYLSQELARWSDVVVGDYNYYFDLSALLHALTQANQWRVSVLVDEAHNLVERARKMYSAELDQADLAGVRASRAGRRCKSRWTGCNRAWNALCARRSTRAPTRCTPDRARTSSCGACSRPPAAITDHLAEHPTRGGRRAAALLLRCAAFLAHGRELFGAHSLFDITLSRSGRAGRQRRAAVPPQRGARAVPDAALCRRPLGRAVLGHAEPAALSTPTCWACPTTPPGSTCRRRSSAEQLAVQVVSRHLHPLPAPRGVARADRRR